MGIKSDPKIAEDYCVRAMRQVRRQLFADAKNFGVSKEEIQEILDSLVIKIS